MEKSLQPPYWANPVDADKFEVYSGKIVVDNYFSMEVS